MDARQAKQHKRMTRRAEQYDRAARKTQNPWRRSELRFEANCFRDFAAQIAVGNELAIVSAEHTHFC